MDFQMIIRDACNELKQNPRSTEDELEVISKYGNMFNPKNIDNLTSEDFKSFLNFKNNKHWTSLERKGPEITQDMRKFKNTLKILLDETIPIDQRIKRIRDNKSPDYQKGFGTAHYTPILLVVYPTKYPVINEIVKVALQRTGLYRDYDSKPEWEAYPEIIPKIVELAVKNNISLWQMDSIWFRIYHQSLESGDNSLWITRAGGKGQDESIALEKNVVGIGYGSIKGLESITDKDTFKKRFVELYPEKAASAAKIVPQIWNFIHNIKIGDLVLLPHLRKSGKIVAVGRIVSDYKDEELSSELSQFRRVEWLKEDVSRDEFDIDIKKSLGRRGTVRRLGGANYVDKVEAMLANLGVSQTRYFLLQVSDYGSETLLKQPPIYHHHGWKETPRDKDHGLVRGGDIILVYFTASSPQFAMHLKKIYQVKSVSKDNSEFILSEKEELKGVSLDILKTSVEKRQLSEKFLKLGQQGFNIIQIDKSDYDTILFLDQSPEDNPEYESIWLRDLVTTFQRLGVAGAYHPLHTIYNVVKDLRISENRVIPKHYQAVVRYYLERNSRGLGKDIFEPKDIGSGFWMLKAKTEKVIAIGNSWSISEEIIDNILELNTARELALDRELVRRIIRHLSAGKHVILVGPPGVGKTELAIRILKIMGGRVVGNDEPLIAVASDDWSRFEIIGGMDLQNRFQEGWIINAAKNNKWLLIDEFNRANMNKAFGEMFLAIERGKIPLRPLEAKASEQEFVNIPPDFRMVCTMNDFDKNLLLTELSYGLITRFAFVNVTPDTKKEPQVVERKVRSILGFDREYPLCKDQIDIYFKFINEVRLQRNIGVRTSIDVIRYLLTAVDGDSNHVNRWIALNDALCDYVLPQFDRLDIKILEHTLMSATKYLQKEQFEPFISELRKGRDNLLKVSDWLYTENDSS